MPSVLARGSASIVGPTRNAPVQLLGLDQPAELFGVDAWREHVRAAGTNVASVVRTSRCGTSVRSSGTRSPVDVGQRADHQCPAPISAVWLSIGAVGPSGERGGVDEQQGGGRVDRGVGIVVRPAGEERLVARRRRVVLQPACRARSAELRARRAPCRRSPRPARRRPRRRGRRATKASSSADLPPVRRAEASRRASPRRAALEHPERVLPEPQDPVAGADAGGGERIGEPVRRGRRARGR